MIGFIEIHHVNLELPEVEAINIPPYVYMHTEEFVCLSVRPMAERKANSASNG